MTTEEFISVNFWRPALPIALALCAAASPCAAQDVPRKGLPLVWVLSTGGTIAGKGSSATDLSNYKSGSLLGEEIVRAVPEITQIANVKVEQIVNVNSSDITLDNWLTLANRINTILADDPQVAGIVVTHGTNTLEVHKDAIAPGQKVLIVDDLLATGGTVLGTIDLVKQLKGDIVGLSFLVELRFLKGRARLGGYDIHSVIQY